jgi:hypothetical protein
VFSHETESPFRSVPRYSVVTDAKSTSYPHFLVYPSLAPVILLLRQFLDRSHITRSTRLAALQSLTQHYERTFEPMNSHAAPQAAFPK